MSERTVDPAGRPFRSPGLWLAAVACLALLLQPALAHITQGPTGGFASGKWSRPVSGWAKPAVARRPPSLDEEKAAT